MTRTLYANSVKLSLFDIALGSMATGDSKIDYVQRLPRWNRDYMTMVKIEEARNYPTPLALSVTSKEDTISATFWVLCLPKLNSGTISANRKLDGLASMLKVK